MGLNALGAFSLVVRTVKASVEDIDRDKQAFSGFVSILFAFDGVRDIQLRLFPLDFVGTAGTVLSLYQVDVGA